ncbi:hypothetical protein QL285_008943 [Trifolium repens]|nr:hypothetical protein QL285_008943 [Trifolium repens]
MLREENIDDNTVTVQGGSSGGAGFQNLHSLLFRTSSTLVQLLEASRRPSRFNSSFTSDKGSIMTTSIINLFTELLVIDEQIALIEQKLKMAKEKRAKKAAALEVAEAALREGEKRAKELTAIHNRKQAMPNEQQALREFEAAKALNLLFQKW